MSAAADGPLDIPQRTLAAIDRAQLAARHTRQSLEAARAFFWAGLGLAAVSLGAFANSIDAPLADWAKWTVGGAGILAAWTGVVLMYAFGWTWIRSGRYGARQSPFADGSASKGGRARVVLFAIAFLAVSVEMFGLQLLRGRIPHAIYYGILIWGTRGAVIAGVAFFIYRYARARFWEYLVFAAGIAATLGVYIFVSPRVAAATPLPICLAAIAIAAAAVATVSLLKRRRAWLRTTAAASPDQGSALAETA